MRHRYNFPQCLFATSRKIFSFRPPRPLSLRPNRLPRALKGQLSPIGNWKAREIAELSQFNDVCQYQCRSLHEDPVGSVKHHFVCVFYRKFYISIYQGHLDCSCHTFHLSAESCCEKHSKGVKPCNISNWVMMAIEAKMRCCLFTISQNSPVNQSSVYCFVSSSASCHFLWAHLT